MSYFSIAGLQLALKGDQCLPDIEQAISNTVARYPWVNMVVLSELGCFGPGIRHAEPLPNDAERALCKLAAKLGVWIVTGSMYECAEDKIFNTAAVINDKGDVVGRYRKHFPFLPYEAGVSCGSEYLIVDVPGGKIGIAICYDLWFPEVARAMATAGADVLLYPTLTGTTDREQELVLARATAIQQQAYVFSINASGEYGNGQSIITDPQGMVLHQAGENEEIMPVEVDFNLVRRTRERGIQGLGQPLKSFRDHPENTDLPDTAQIYLNQLGELTMPEKV